MEDYYVINYNGMDLNYFVSIKEIRRQILPERTNYSVDLASSHGQQYTGYKVNPRVIEVDFIMQGVTPKKIRDFARLLNTETPQRLLLSDDPGMYYMAVVDGSVDMDELLQLGTGTITFLCHDPYAYSDESKVFDATGNGVVTLDNWGSADTHPFVSVEFKNDAHFLQCTNYTGETVLVGKRPVVDNAPATGDVTLINDACETLTGWTASGNVVDSGRLVEGTMSIGLGNNAIVPNQYGTTIDKGWHGPSMRKSLGANATDFTMTARIKFDSLGKPTGTNNYGDQSNGGSNTTPPVAGAIYQVNTRSGVNVRSGRGTSFSKLTAIPNGKQCTITEISSGWGKVTYNGKTGYTCMTYWKFIKNNVSTFGATTFATSTENKMGRMELYGFDSTGAKLFKCVLRDSEEWYEYTQPEVYIGNSLVLSDNKTCPKPQQIKVEKDNYNSSTPNSTTTTPSTSVPSTKGVEVVTEAKKHIGKKYVWGASGPNTFDCSGFMYYCMKTCGINTSRKTALTFSQASNKITRSQLQAGDLVFWNDKTGSKHSSVYHVGMYAGNNEIVDCSTDHGGVGTRTLSSLVDSSSRYFTFGRYPLMNSSTTSTSTNTYSLRSGEESPIMPLADPQTEYEYVNTNSGRYGDWNEYYGDIVVKRITNTDGTQKWWVQVTKIVNGKVERTMSGVFTNSSYPKGALNNLVLWYGQYNDKSPCDDVGLCHVKVVSHNKPLPTENFKIFKAGDRLEIDMSENKVYLNDNLFMEHVDIGSEFFTTPPGFTQLRVLSDDASIDSTVGIIERFL